MSQLVERGSKYTDDIRRQAAVEYAVKGNVHKVADTLNIPRTTVLGWTRSDWFNELIEEVRQEKSDEHVANYHAIVDKAQRVTMDKLDDATAAQASIIAATATDKARLLLNQPTSIQGKSDSVDRLAQEFRELSRKWDMKVVSTQHPESED